MHIVIQDNARLARTTQGNPTCAISMSTLPEVASGLEAVKVNIYSDYQTFNTHILII